MDWSTKRRLALFWISEHSGPLGLLLGVFLVAGVGLLSIPTGPSAPYHGVITTLGIQQTEAGGHARARVRLSDGRIVSVKLPRDARCIVGASIQMTCAKRTIGVQCLLARCGAPLSLAEPHRERN